MSTNLARATKVIDRTAEKVGTRAPLLAQALKRANLLVPDAPTGVPEPGVLALTSVALAALIGRRRPTRA